MKTVALVVLAEQIALLPGTYLRTAASISGASFLIVQHLQSCDDCEGSDSLDNTSL